MPATVQNKIDVHHHVYPPVYSEALHRLGGDPSGWYIPPWTLESDNELCEHMGVGTALLSCTAPGPDISKDITEAQTLARACNEFNANIRNSHPKQYGFFASVPNLTETETALEEMAHALDALHADGVILFTRYGNDNHYLGHADFTPIWDFLNSRTAVVFIHPTHPVDTNLVNKRLPQPAFDYPHETGRTAIDLITSNMLRDHASNCKIILSHAGGDLPYLIDRAAGLLPHAPSSFNPEKSRDEMLNEARSFYYDTALSSSPMHLKALVALLGEVGKDHVLFGTDFPNAPVQAIEYFTNQLGRQCDVNDETLRENGLKLFPRLRI
ncbi:hypothetical protein LTR37_018719 [Vermiconidia calcicola]|uniref:Uncharacterized protein n=1 Tax=Vermiconidia calcicola TaxID=1690605 RepID=A0ACC3MI25_9PEZI|nr:hypothetical protein LTR37_018719 [Vermiconidia calcicola]